MSASLRIGQVAERAGVRVDTVRYYERRGLLPRAARRQSGYRAFDDGAVERIRFIKRAQELGFALGEIEELLRLHREADARCADVRDMGQEKIADIEQRIADLERMREGLRILVACCDSNTRLSECPIVECFAGAAAGGGTP